MNKETAGNEKDTELDASGSRALIESENDLRFALGRYLHDYPQQRVQAALSLLKEQSETLEHAPAVADAGLAATIARLTALLEQADRELSLARREILPADPQRGLFRVALESYIYDDFPRLYPDLEARIEVSLAPLEEIFDRTGEDQAGAEAAARKMTIGLFVREALRNVVKHARATRVAVQAELLEETLRVAVEDDGQGFDPVLLTAGRRATSFQDFETRARLLGGRTRLIARPGQGTRWELYLPAGPERMVNHERQG